MFRKIIAIIIVFLILTVILPTINGLNKDLVETNSIKSTDIFVKNILYVGGDGPGNYTNIQDAIDDAKDGDTIFVYSGIYDGGLNVYKSITIKGENRENTFIEGTAGPGFNGISIYSDSVNVTGFTFRKIGNFWPDSAIYINSNDNIISNNIITNNKLGIDIIESRNTTISQNLIINQDRYYGMFIGYSRNNQISNNIISNNNGGGITMIDSYENTISQNTISNNHWGGINLLDRSRNNIIYHNNFFNNLPENGYDIGLNTWDNNDLSEGNYWDDYAGIDANKDGIGDTPYNITGGENKDRFPLIEPYEIPKFIIDFKTNLLKFSIKNIGNKTAYNVQWEIAIDGGFIPFGRHFSGSLLKPLLPDEEALVVSSGFVFGLGYIKITIELWAINTPRISETIDGRILLFLIFIL